MKIRLLLSTLLLIAPLSFAATYNVTFTAPTTRLRRKVKKMNRHILWFTLCLLCTGVISSAMADVVRVDCIPPTTRESGTPLADSEIAGYELITNRNSITSTYPFAQCGTDLIINQPGEYSAYAVTLDTGGRRSKPSNTVTFTIEQSPPEAPGNVRIIVITIGAGG